MNEMIKVLDRLCSFNSVAVQSDNKEAPYGEEVKKALEYVLDVCKGFGFKVKNCGNIIGWAEIGEGEELVGIPVHLDIVPAGEGWDYTPFGATVTEDGKLVGRGVCDDKGPAVACIFAMRDILEKKIKLNRRVRLIFGQAEENGEWTDMEYYKENEELPVFGFTPDGDFPAIYGEKGILNLKLAMPGEKSGIIAARGGNAPNMVADKAQAQVNIGGKTETLCETGKAAHGSMPWDGENAVSKLFRRLEELGVTGGFTRFYNDLIGFDLHGERIGAGFSDEKSGKLVFNVGLLEANEKECSITVNLRCPVDCTAEQVQSAIEDKCAEYGVSVTRLSWQAPVYMDKDGGVVGALVDVYREFTEDLTEPQVIGGGTYARAMDNIVAFGPSYPGMELTEHQKNEYIPLNWFLRLREIYFGAIVRLANI